MREVTPGELTHERLGDSFREALSEYDTQRRVEILIDRFLDRDQIEGADALDVGCGLGFFSRRLVEHGADVTASDIGSGLVERAAAFAGCKAVVADALALTDHFGRDRFDLVVSSECIEHTPDPAAAIRQMLGVLRPGGLLSLSTPNRIWHPAVALATKLRLRPFDGHENFSTFRSIATTLDSAGADVLERRGLHLFPFQLGLHDLSRWCDDHLQVARHLMINLCVLARKRDRA